MKKRLLSLLLVLVMVLGMVPTAALAATDLTVTDNVIDITDKVIYQIMSGWHATVSNLTIDGATVESATEDGTTINVTLADDTDPYGTVTATFGWTLGTFGSGSQNVTSVELADGQGTLTVVVTGKVSNRTGTATYTINFESAAKATEPPAVAGETALTADVYTTLPLALPVSEYFGKAAAYYLVDGETYTEIDKTYTATWEEPGTYDLVFAAGNSVGYSENVTVTVTVTEIPKYDVTVVIADGYAPTFYAVTGIESNAAVLGKELSYADGVVKVPQNISRIAWTSKNGVGMSAPVSEGGTLNIQAASFTAKTAIDETDSAAAVTVKDSEGYTVSGTVADTFLMAAGAGYTFTVAPGSTYSGYWNTATLSSQTVTTDAEATVDVVYTLKNGKTITAPKEADVTMYYQSPNFKASEVAPVYSTENTEAGTVTYYYACSSATDMTKGYAYRAILDEDSIVKAGFMNAVTDVVLSWSEDDESPDFRGNTNVPNGQTSDGRTKVYRTGDGLYLNVNSTGHLVLENGESKELAAFRTWGIINSDTTNVAIEPQYNYIKTAGDDIYTLGPVEGATAYGNNWQKLTATDAGTAFLEVSYDAIHIVNGWEAGGYGGAYGQISNYTYNATDPEQTGLIVVQTDGNAASDVSFGIASDKTSHTWDAEHDTYFFTENNGTLKLSPTATSGITSVAVSTDKGESWQTLTADENGVYTASIVSGNNIIRVVNGEGKTAYQVVRGAKLTISVQNLTDATAGASFKPGDKVRVIFDGLIAPVYKMAGIYNPQQTKVNLTGTDGKAYATTGVGYMFGAPYSYGGNDYYYTSIEVTIPADTASLTEDGTFVLSGGYISAAGYNDTLGTHRTKASYVNGVAQNTTAQTGTITRSVLEDIVLTPEVPEKFAVTIPTGDGFQVEGAQTATQGEDYTFTVTVTEGYDATNMVVTVNGETVTAGEDGAYTVAAVSGALVIEVTGVVASNNAPVASQESVQIEMRLNDWYDIDLSEYFSDEDGDELTYYVVDGESEAKLEGSEYRYYPESDGMQAAVFKAYDPAGEYAQMVLAADVEEAEAEVTVTVSVTEGVDKFYKTPFDVILKPTEITVPYFDLALYGLEAYYYNPQCYASANGKIGSGTAGTKESAEGIVTGMHVFIWMTEVFYLGYDEADAGTGASYESGEFQSAVSWSGGAGSSYADFWEGENLNYYINMEYPLGAPGWGLTADQDAMYDGDEISVHFIEDVTVTGSYYTALVSDDGDGEYEFGVDKTELTVEKGESVTLNAFYSSRSYTEDITPYFAYCGRDVYMIDSDNFSEKVTDWTKLGAATDENGKIVIDTSKLKAGEYCIAVTGEIDYENYNEGNVGMFKLVVEEPEVTYGDLNGDGEIGALDAAMVYAIANSKLEATEAQLAAADVNGDGEVGALDAAMIYAYANGKLEQFPVEAN